MTGIELSWPETPGSLLLWTELTLVWVLANYGPVRDPVGRQEVVSMGPDRLREWRRRVGARAILGGGGVLLLVGPGLSAVVLSTVFLALALLLPELRQQCIRRVREGRPWELRSEYELAVNVLFLVVAGGIVGGRNLRPTLDAAIVPFPAGELASGLLVVSAVVFLVRGGTHVVRGVLEKSDVLPVGTGSMESTLRHGLTIGNLERFLIFVFVLLHSFAAVGFVLAAKGLVRAVDWEGREGVEYFLVGTFASTALALVVGLLVRRALQA